VAEFGAAVSTARERVDVTRRRVGASRLELEAAQRQLLLALDEYIAALRSSHVSPRSQLTGEAELLRLVTGPAPLPSYRPTSRR